jgi:hypothetical protein
LSKMKIRNLVIWLYISFSVTIICTLYLIQGTQAATTLIPILALWLLVWLSSGGVKSYDGQKVIFTYGLILILLELLIGLWFWHLADLSDPSSPNSPIGKSSCASEVGPSFSLPYNPNGWYSKGPAYMFCPIKGGHWASVSNRNFTGYHASTGVEIDLSRPCLTTDTSCEFLATLRPQDYQSDLGSGISGGWLLGSTTLEKEPCPGVDRTAHDPITGTNGAGRHVCATCSMYMMLRGMEDLGIGLCNGVAHADNPYCFLCEDVSLHQSLVQRKWTSYLYFAHLIGGGVLVASRMYIHKSK